MNQQNIDKEILDFQNLEKKNMDNLKTAELVSALQKGDDNAATAVYEMFYNDIYFFLLKTVKDPQLASDLTQDAFTEVRAHIGDLKVPSGFIKWSRKIAYQRYTTHMRRRQDLLLDDKEKGYSLMTTHNELEWEFFPDENVDQDELRQTICDMIDTLPEKLRTAIIMRYYDELSIKDIANIQNSPEETVKTRLSEGRSAIEQSIAAFEQKHNIKFDNTGIIPIILWFFREDRLKNGLSLTEMTPAAKEALANVLKKASKTLVKKIVIRIAAGIIATGCAALIMYLRPSETVSKVPSTSDITEVDKESQHIASTDIDHNKSENIGTTESPVESPSKESSSEEIELEEIPLIDSEGLEFTLSDDGTYYKVSGIGTCTDTKVAIPREYNGLLVSTIGAYAFNNCIYITEIIIPDTVTTIEENAFSYSSKLTSITIPNSVTNMGDFLFSGCDNLKQLVVEADNPVYHSSGNCIIETASKTLISVCPASIIPSDGSATNIGEFLFCSCDDLKNIVIPEGITTLENRAFFHCDYLYSVSLPVSLQFINDSVFRYCPSLTDFYYSGTKEQWYSIKRTLGWDPEHGNYIIHCIDGDIYSSTHKDAPQIDSVGLSFSLSEDGTYYILTDLGLCTDDRIIIPSEYNGIPVTTIGENAFSNGVNIQEIVIPNSITAIHDSAFSNCALRSIHIPASVTKIGNEVFRFDDRLSKITVEKGNLFYHSHGNCLIETASKTLIVGCNTSVIPTDGSVTIIGDYAFDSTDLSSSFTIPECITTIGNYAFQDCKLNYLVVPYGVKHIGRGAFANTSITSISLSNSIESIGDNAFSYCTELTDLTIPSSVTNIEGTLASGCDKLKTLFVEKGNTIYHSSGNCIIETSTKTLIEGCNTSTIPTDGSVIHIGNSAFWHFSNLIRLTIPEGIESIGLSAFAYCDNLTKITLPSSLTTISSSAFYENINLTDIYYAGTMEQWTSIYKMDSSYQDTNIFTVHCSDGNITN